MLTDQQKIIRKSGIGGSDAAAVCGLSKWKTPYSVYKNKTSDDIDDDSDKEYLYWGSKLEHEIRDHYQMLTGNTVLYSDTTLAHLDYDFILGNLDGFIPETNRVLELKTARYRDPSIWGDEGSNDIPIDYIFQVAHYCMIKNATGADIAVLFAGSEFKIYKYERNEKLEKLLLNKEMDFWENNVKKQIPPEIKCLEDAQKEFSNVVGGESIADDFIESQVEAYKSIKEKQKSLQKSEDKIKTDLLMHMRENKKLVDKFGNILLTYGDQTRESLCVKDLKIDYPEIYSKYAKTSKFRTMRIKK